VSLGFRQESVYGDVDCISHTTQLATLGSFSFNDRAKELSEGKMFFYGCAAVGLTVTFLVWWYIPILAVKRFNLTNGKERAELEDDYRKTISQAIGAIAVIATFVWTFVKDRETISQTREQLDNQAKQFSEQQKQAANQFANQQFIAAAALLKESAVGTRMAGLYSIEQIAKSQPEYRVPSAYAALGFIKSPVSLPHKDDKDTEWSPIGADTQSAIGVLASLNGDHRISVDLQGAYLVRGNFVCSQICTAFTGANFQNARLYGANLSSLNLTGAKFDGSYMADWEAYADKWKTLSPDDYENTRQDYVVNFNNSMMINTGFDHVNMGGVTFENACLAGARFWLADLSRATFKGASLGNNAGCDFSGKKAHFYQATLIDAEFDGVDVGGVNFGHANLSGTNFTKALNVETAVFDGACGDDRTKFPASTGIAIAKCRK
jgi:uncharacterized protein YjbI with pentapeptide repeats